MNVVCHRCARQAGALTFRITTNRVVMFDQPRKSSDRGMLPNLNHGTYRLVIRLDRHVERIAFYFITARRMSRTF
jgi:hypothetical protein